MYVADSVYTFIVEVIWEGKCPGGKCPSRFYLGDLGGTVRGGSVRVGFFFLGGNCPGGT